MMIRLSFRTRLFRPFRLRSFVLVLLAPLFLLPACEPFVLDNPFGRRASGLDHPFAVAPRRILEGGALAGHRPAGDGPQVWMTGVEFPASYDWERDTAYGTINCRLVLFSGSERVLTVDAGPSFEISPDPDMHRVVGGHLYTDYSTDAETVIKRDGVELFRFSGREAIRGFLVPDGHVHTLGEDRYGDGFTYRIDGEVVLSREDGVLLPGGERCPESIQNGALYMEGGQVCFSYYIPGTPPSVFLVRSGRETPVTPDPSVAEVLDQRLYGGVLYRVEKRSHTFGRPYFVAGESSSVLAGEPRLSPDARKCRLVPSGDEMYVRGWYHYPDGADEFHLWSGTGILFQELRPLHAFSVLPSSSSGPGTMAYVLSLPSGLLIGKGEATWSPIGRYRLYTPSCAVLIGSAEGESKYYVALSGPSCILWVDGVITPIPLHGFLSGVWIE